MPLITRSYSLLWPFFEGCYRGVDWSGRRCCGVLMRWFGNNTKKSDTKIGTLYSWTSYSKVSGAQSQIRYGRIPSGRVSGDQKEKGKCEATQTMKFQVRPRLGSRFQVAQLCDYANKHVRIKTLAERLVIKGRIERKRKWEWQKKKETRFIGIK